MIQLVYGKRCLQWSGSDAEQYFEGVKLLNNATDPGAHPPIDLLWPLKYIPARWAPWTPLCVRTKAVRDELYVRLLNDCDERLKNGTGVGCFIETTLSNQEELGTTRDEIQ